MTTLNSKYHTKKLLTEIPFLIHSQEMSFISYLFLVNLIAFKQNDISTFFMRSRHEYDTNHIMWNVQP